jgi:NADP-dependent 3-hydroxy acid dehydrogenase YdfG
VGEGVEGAGPVVGDDAHRPVRPHIDAGEVVQVASSPVDRGPRVAIVTGGSSGSGIGLGVGRLLVARGYDVVLSARAESTLRAAAEDIGARWAAGDSADPSAAARVVAEAGRVDLLVHAAGVMAGTFVREESVETFADVLRTVGGQGQARQ